MLIEIPFCRLAAIVQYQLHVTVAEIHLHVGLVAFTSDLHLPVNNRLAAAILGRCLVFTAVFGFFLNEFRVRALGAILVSHFDGAIIRFALQDTA